MTMSGTADVRISYFSFNQIGDDYISGLLTVDISGHPVDFRYTTPIQPSEIQKALYGKSLNSHIKEKLMAKQLFKAINFQPNVVICHMNNLSMISRFSKSPVAVSETSLSTDLSRWETKQIKPEEFIFQEKENHSPIRLVFQNMPPGKIQTILQVFSDIKGRFPILEPFERLNTAFNLLCSK